MKTVPLLMIAGALVFAFGQSGYAQMQASPPAAPAAPAAPAVPAAPKVPKPKAPMSPKAMECSAKADTQGLHGKARKEFREKCKKGET
ncbi:MAG: PsiF family protein [Methylocella sp.]